jgi:sulfur transfer protein SufE
MSVVPFKPPETFERFGIDWTRDATNDNERSLREAFLTYETSCGLNGLVSLVLLAIVCGRQGAVASDLQAAADLAEITLSMKLRKHRNNALEAVHAYLLDGGTVWP